MSTLGYPRFTLQLELAIEHLYTYYYFELPPHYTTVKEQNDFWTLCYMDKGEIRVFTDGRERLLKQGDIILYAPDTHHWGQTTGKNAPNIMIVTFDCASPCLDGLRDASFPLLDDEKKIISILLQEAYGAFELLTQDCMIIRKPAVPFAGEQLVKNYLEILLLRLIRRQALPDAEQAGITSTLKQNRDSRLHAEIVRHMRKHLSTPLSVEALCRQFGVGKAQLSASFKQSTGYGLMEYFNLLKIEEAKKLIRENNCTVTEIADRLGYNNVQYFSKQFKRICGMKPTEYGKTVQVRFGRGDASLTALSANPFLVTPLLDLPPDD
ncbi:AraC family transcriptional regulator [Paenibacillus hodogayensis]|uniref:AraC family transcriptional regulator n=1 Tax=Paenibacillus hodogayensis TaxID=279208 RepID=A0ABV5VS72_9BACL